MKIVGKFSVLRSSIHNILFFKFSQIFSIHLFDRNPPVAPLLHAASHRQRHDFISTPIFSQAVSQSCLLFSFPARRHFTTRRSDRETFLPHRHHPLQSTARHIHLTHAKTVKKENSKILR